MKTLTTIAVFLAAGVTGWAWSVSTLKGEATPAVPAVVTVGSRLATVPVKNLGGKPLVIAGASSTCRCSAAGGLPAVVGPGETFGIPVEVTRDFDGSQITIYFPPGLGERTVRLEPAAAAAPTGFATEGDAR